MKFKTDDIVEIVFNTCYHGFEIGYKVEIVSTFHDGYEAYDQFNNLWCFTDSDCKAIQGELQ